MGGVGLGGGGGGGSGSNFVSLAAPLLQIFWFYYNMKISRF